MEETAEKKRDTFNQQEEDLLLEGKEIMGVVKDKVTIKETYKDNFIVVNI